MSTTIKAAMWTFAAIVIIACTLAMWTMFPFSMLITWAVFVVVMVFNMAKSIIAGRQK